MDIFCEHIVKKSKTLKDRVKQVGIILLAILLIELLLVFNSMLFGFGFLLIFGVIYGAIFLYKKTNIEYEYILTNSILDIDKIFAKSSRKRVESIDFKSVEVFGKGNASSSGVKEIDYAGDITADDVYYFELIKNGERVRIYFQPSQKILANLHTVAPRVVPAYDVISE